MAPVSSHFSRFLLYASDRMASTQMSDFREQLFPYLPSERFSTFSCGHVVSQEQVFTSVVSKGPSGTPLTFTYSTRKDEKLVSLEKFLAEGEPRLTILRPCSSTSSAKR